MQFNFDLSPVYGSGRDHFSRRLFLGPRVDAPCILQGILIHCNLCGLEFLVPSLRKCRLLLLQVSVQESRFPLNLSFFEALAI